MIEWNDMSELPECENPHDTKDKHSFFDLLLETEDGKHWIGIHVSKEFTAEDGSFVDPGFYAMDNNDVLHSIPKVIAWSWLNGSPWHPALQKNLKANI